MMIRQKIYIEKYDWTVYIYYAVSCYYIYEILAKLYVLNCPRKYIATAKKNMSDDKLNHGLTYSDINSKKSVMVIGLTTTAGEFFNSLVHEIHHLVSHICEYYNIPLTGEESCYLAGDIAFYVYPKIRKLLCSYCRNTI